MIKRLNKKNLIDVYDFLLTIIDKEKDFYITINKERIFLKDSLKLIEKILKYHEVYGKFDSSLKAIYIIYREKGFRPYLKILAEKKLDYIDLIRFLKWQASEIELFCKLKKENSIIEYLHKAGFFKIGDRGKEILLIKKPFKINKLISKDEGDINDRDNRENQEFNRRPFNNNR